jgi:hypothetical protein
MPSAKNLNARLFRQRIQRPHQFLAEKSTSSNTSAPGDPDPDFLVSIMCAMIEQAFKDLQNEATYKSTHKNNEIADSHRTAKAFFNSRFFLELCLTLNLPADKILRRALA